MARLLSYILIVGFLALTGSSWSSVFAESTVTCHCFRDRQFSPEHPQAFDPYLLATVQNRLMGHAFSVPRKEIVKQKMGGRSNSRLWVAYYIAEASDRPVSEILSSRATNDGWLQTARQYQLDPEQLDSAFMAALLQDASESHLAWSVVRTVLFDHFIISPEQLSTSPRSSPAIQEIIFASILASQFEQTLEEIYARKRQAGSWGALLAENQLSIAQIEDQILRRMKILR